MAQTKAQLIDGKGAVDLGALSISGSAPDNSVNLDASGRLLVGTSTSRNNFFNLTTYNPRLQIEGTDYSSSMASVVCNSTTDSSVLIIGRTRGTSVGSNTAISSGDSLGVLSFQGSDGSELVEAARIEAYVDATPGANDMPGRLVFSTTADGASSPTESFRITNAGRAIFNRLGTPTDTDFVVQVFSDSTVGGVAVQTNQTGARTAIRFRNPNGIIGEIITNGSATAYNTSSDYRLKENVAAVADGIIRLQQLKPSRFNFKANPTNTVDGFIAHEVQAVVPEAVTGEKDAVDDDGNPIYQGIDQSKLVPLLTAALQEAIGEIESLKARLTAAGI